MDFIIVVVYIAIFAIGVFFDIRKKKKAKKSARDSVNETINRHTESNASRPDLKSFKEAEERSRKIKEEFEKLSKKINAAKHTSEQLLKEKMKMNSNVILDRDNLVWVSFFRSSGSYVTYNSSNHQCFTLRLC